jgi:hypothetical protein
MALSSSIQAQIAFKNLLGKSQTDDLKGLANESIGIGFDVPSFNVMMDQISPTASESVTNGVAVKVVADLTVINGSNNKAYQTYWPTSAPSGNDIKNNNLPFAYGVGSLEYISSGQKMTNLISDAFGTQYQAVPKDNSSNVISLLDNRDWIYQYNSGVYYQNNLTPTPTTPTTIDVYYYIGSRLIAQSQNTQTNIRVSATGSTSVSSDIYFATYSTPSIATYSSNYLFLVDFNKTNLSATVSLNINGIGTSSVIKYTANGPVPLSPGDIIGATGGTASQIYYLVYNNSVFEFYTKNPLSDPSTLTNPVDTAYTVGGIDRGTQFDKVSLQDVFKDLLYPDQLGRITGFTMANNTGQVNSYEVGNSLPRQTYTFSWGLSNATDFRPNTLRVEDYTDSVVFTFSTTNVSPFNVTYGTFSYNTPTTKTFKVSLTRNNGTIVSKFLDIPWMWKVYYGSSTWSTLTASQVFALGGNLATQSIGSWTISGDGYKYIAFPEDTSYNFNSVDYKGLPLSMAGTISGYSYSYADVNYLFVTVSNTYGISKQYKVYRSKNQIGATISVNIN